MNAEEIKKNALAEIKLADSSGKLGELRIKYLGRQGELSQLLAEIPELPRIEDRKRAGLVVNTVKEAIESALRKKDRVLKKQEQEKLEAIEFDPTVPGETIPSGTLHPLTQFRIFVRKSFERLGFEEVYAPHIETDDYNFGLLNMPPDHPARDLWDTLYLDNPPSRKATGGKALLRSHTSNIQVREMRKRSLPAGLRLRGMSPRAQTRASRRGANGGPPIKVMSFDRCFRYEALDPRHSHTFTHFDILYIDKGVSMANLKWLSNYFLKRTLGEGTKARFRPKYYPFVEPGVGVDALCPFCQGRGCKICGKGWLEIAGAGMVHPKVLENGGIDPKIYSGLAWGFGPDRMLMIKLGIDDIRYFYEGDLRFLKQF